MVSWKRLQKRLVLILVLVASVLFVVLYIKNLTPIEKPEKQPHSSMEEWSVEDSSLNGIPLVEDKSIYPEEPDTQIYDVYLSVFPTKDSTGEMIDFSAFGLHQARNHDYNPVLNCNVQILEEGKKIDPLTSIDSKNATIRVRGNSSRGDTYKSYKLKLEEEAQPFFGQTSLNINKHSEDIVKIATKLQTDLLEKVDNIVSYQTYFMRVWIRDTSVPEEEQKFKYYGLYTETEQPNKTYLEKRGLSNNASMYKARDFSFNRNDKLKNIDDPGYNIDEFESVLGIREATDHTALLEMVEAVNDMDRDFEEIFGTYFNEENYLTWLAFNILVGSDDILNHNYILYNPNNAKTWYFFPWDFDSTLKFGEKKGEYAETSLSIVQKLNMSPFHRRYLRLNGSIEKIENKMQELLDTTITKEAVTSLVNSYKPVLEKTIPLHPDIELMDMTPPELNDYLDGLHGGIAGSLDMFKESIEYPTPMYVSMPVKQEDGSLELTWETSYSYQGKPITYNVSIYEDYQREKVVMQQKDIAETSYVYDKKLLPGTYYLDIKAVDTDGDEQYSMEHYEAVVNDLFHFANGLLEFTIE